MNTAPLTVNIADNLLALQNLVTYFRLHGLPAPLREVDLIAAELVRIKREQAEKQTGLTPIPFRSPVKAL